MVCADCVDRLSSVDCFGFVGYISHRALKVASSFSISWHLAFVRAAQFLAAPQSLSPTPQNRFLRGMTRAIFFHQFSSHLIPSPDCLLTDLFLLPGYQHIHIAPLLATLSSTRMGGEAHGCDTTDGGRDVCVLDFMRAMDGDGNGGDGDVVACLISGVLCHPSLMG